MAELPSELAEALERFEVGASDVANRSAWEALRLEWLGRKRGHVRAFEQKIREVPNEEKRVWGQGLKQLKTRIDEALDEIDARLSLSEQSAAQAAAAIDVTLPGRRPKIGGLHAITRVNREVERVFLELGYSVAEGVLQLLKPLLLSASRLVQFGLKRFPLALGGVGRLSLFLRQRLLLLQLVLRISESFL